MHMSTLEKRCRDCGAEKPYSEFYKHPTCADGHLSRCRECICRRTRERTASKRDEINAAKRAAHAANPERKAASGRRYREKNKDSLRLRKAAYYQSNKDRIAEQQSERYHRDPQVKLAALAAARRWREANPEKRREVRNAWAHRNPGAVLAGVHRRRARIETNGPNDFTEQDWQERLTAFGGACVYCGSESDLVRDHVIPLARGGVNTKFNVVPACKDCNYRKHARPLPEFLALHGD